MCEDKNCACHKYGMRVKLTEEHPIHEALEKVKPKLERKV